MPTYNLIEYSDNYSKTSGSLWKYCKEIPVVSDNGNIVNFNENNTTDSFKFKAKITGQTNNNGEINGVEIMVPLKYLSNFCRTLEMPVINCEIELILTWSRNSVIISTNTADQIPIFTITETNLYVPVVALSTQDNAKLLTQLKSGFKRTITWNKYLAKPELLAQNANLNHLIEPSFKYITTFDYIDKILVILSAASGEISIISFTSVIGAPVGIASASVTLIFSLTTGIVKKLLNITRKKKKKHDKILMLAKSKFHSIDTLIS